ncbi:hypothetical protein DPM13_09490 [Paracoccus mutanolyticus]|uniref:ABC transmembrane type-1 domain-containing protein n=1 Tax=Paracoccus mutanolyticus TaxID=1499308 RepID=A0ABM6WRS1_9RHOB|nr:hypothetical protein DPM13_09490 [Paracoccus mutanolyticus]
MVELQTARRTRRMTAIGTTTQAGRNDAGAAAGREWQPNLNECRLTHQDAGWPRLAHGRQLPSECIELGPTDLHPQVGSLDTGGDLAADTGRNNAYAAMDLFAVQMGDTADGVLRGMGSISRGVLGAVTYIMLAVLIAVYILIVGFAKIMIAVLLGLAPFAIIMTLFDKTKSHTDRLDDVDAGELRVHHHGNQLLLDLTRVAPAFVPTCDGDPLRQGVRLQFPGWAPRFTRHARRLLRRVGPGRCH